MSETELRRMPPNVPSSMANMGAVSEGQRCVSVVAMMLPGAARLGRQSGVMLRWKSLDVERPGPHFSGKLAVVGHTPQKTGEILNLGHLLCIDTYCYGGGWLTALEAESGRYWQANERGEVREGRLESAEGPVNEVNQGGPPGATR